MKVYFYSCKKNINSYLLINESSKEAILIDPCDVLQYFIEKLENECISLKAVCVTNSNIEEIKKGVRSWKNIYDFTVFEHSNLFSNSAERAKVLQFSSFNIEVFCAKNNSKIFCSYKIENTLFTGQSLLALIFHSSLPNELVNKSQESDKHTIIFPLSGPPMELKTLKSSLTLLKHNLAKT